MVEHQAGIRKKGGVEGWGQPTRSPVNDVRGSKGTDVASHSLHQLLLQLRAVLDVLHEGHVSIDALPLHRVLIPAWHKSMFNLDLAIRLNYYFRHSS